MITRAYKKFLAFLTLATFVAILGAHGAEQVRDIPSDIQVFGPAGQTDGGVPQNVIPYLRWPSTDFILQALSRTKPGEGTFFAPIRTIRIMLQEQWIPTDIDGRLLPLKHAVESNDAVAVRYEVGGYYVQAIQTSFAIGICVRPISNKERVVVASRDDAIKHVEATIDRFLNEANNIKAICTNDVRRVAFGFAGKPLMFNASPIRGSQMHWWGMLSWWTDGDGVAFITGKPTPSTQPIEVKDWF